MTEPNKESGQANSGVGNLARILENEPAFRAFLGRQLGDRTIADDVFQQCLVRAIEHQHTIKREESVVPWFYRVLRNAVIDYYRAKAAQRGQHDAFEKDAQVLQLQAVPSLDEIKGTICHCIEEVIAALRPNYAELIRRIDLHGEAPAMVAKALHISQNNATVRLHRARQALRMSLEATCGVCTKHGCLNCTCSTR
ncbi:MAG: ECF family RNA polymerase sigma factor [Candidatus Nitrospira kreftii]|uniref:ECF family RNA polymerase sigma factor n=1 Tax=Candidatus Nitrospira kreftii TaxID=2652173 RepID=A0A7S8FBC8_9BACT|nr:MAG: ECF family RNA polymerase sigma factor [Candidatus Nitrospira kreftii]